MTSINTLQHPRFFFKVTPAYFLIILPWLIEYKMTFHFNY